jgi:DNA-binding NarL/FixJ family response regulator
MSQVKVLALVRELLLRSRIEAVAQTVGVEAAYASTIEQAKNRCAELNPTVVFADLSDANFAAHAVADGLREVAPTVRLIGFASHVDLKALGAAREAGFELTLSRSEFTARLPELLKP